MQTSAKLFLFIFVSANLHIFLWWNTMSGTGRIISFLQGLEELYVCFPPFADYQGLYSFGCFMRFSFPCLYIATHRT